MKSLTREQYFAEAEKRYGKNKREWKFKCPSCGHVAAVQDWLDHEGGDTMVAFSCVGRLMGSAQELGSKDGGPCNYVGDGLFRLNPIPVQDDESDEVSWFFDFADDPLEHKEAA